MYAVRRLSLIPRVSKSKLFPFSVSGANHFSVKSSGERLDTLILVRSMEEEGVPSKQAESIIANTKNALNARLEEVCQSAASKAEMQKIQMKLKSDLDSFKAEMNMSKAHHFGQLHNDTEKLRYDVEKIRIELRNELDKVTRESQLDLQLEMMKIWKEWDDVKAEIDKVINKRYIEIDLLRGQLAAVKHEFLKYVIGGFLCIFCVVSAIVSLMK